MKMELIGVDSVDGSSGDGRFECGGDDSENQQSTEIVQMMIW